MKKHEILLIVAAIYVAPHMMPLISVACGAAALVASALAYFMGSKE